MGRDEQVRQLPERAVGWERLGLEHVEMRRGDVARPQRLGQRVVLHHRPARGVDDNCAPVHGAEGRAVERMSRLGRRAQMHRHDVGLGQRLVQPVEGDHPIGVRVRPGAALHADHAHAELPRQPRGGRADAAEPDDQQGLTADRAVVMQFPDAPDLLAQIARQMRVQGDDDADDRGRMRLGQEA
jgi:hypothetical protein